MLPFDSTPANVESALEPTFGSARRLNVSATSCVVIWVPSSNFTPWRILNVHTLPSWLGFQPVAICGCRVRLRSENTRNWPFIPSTASPPSSEILTGSIAAAGDTIPARIVPPGLGAWVWGGDTLVTSGRAQPAITTPSAEIDMPSAVPRRMNSRRPMRSDANSSIRWFSTSPTDLRTASDRSLAFKPLKGSDTRLQLPHSQQTLRSRALSKSTQDRHTRNSRFRVVHDLVTGDTGCCITIRSWHYDCQER